MVFLSFYGAFHHQAIIETLGILGQVNKIIVQMRKCLCNIILWHKQSAIYRFLRISPLCRSLWTLCDALVQTPGWPCTPASAILSAPPIPGRIKTDRYQHENGITLLNAKIKRQTKKYEIAKPKIWRYTGYCGLFTCRAPTGLHSVCCELPEVFISDWELRQTHKRATIKTTQNIIIWTEYDEKRKKNIYFYIHTCPHQ